MNLINVYLGLVRKRFIPNPFFVGLILGIILGLNMTGVEVSAILLILLIPYAITEKEFNLFFTMPIKTADIINVKYINSYIQVILGFIIGGILLVFSGEFQLGYLLYKLFVVLIELNIILAIVTDKGLRVGMEPEDTLGPIIILLITGAFYFLGVENKDFILNNSLIISLISFAGVFITFRMSYKSTSNKVY